MSVSVPRLWGEKPNLVFKAPTYENREASFFPARQGGNKNIVAAGPYLLFIVLTVKVLGEWITIKNLTTQLNNPVENISTALIFRLPNIFNGVNYINLHIPHQLILSHQ